MSPKIAYLLSAFSVILISAEIEQDISVEESTSATLACSLKKTGQNKSYDMNGSEVTDFSFKDDGYYEAGIEGNYTRDDVREVVTDEITGLMWQDNEEAATVTKQWVTQANYDDGNYSDTTGDTATTYCENLVIDLYDDWRLPTITELMYILDYGNATNALDPAFAHTAQGLYWSSSDAVATEGSAAWTIDFPLGSSSYWASKNELRHIRCVRGSFSRGKNYTRDVETQIVTDRITGLEWQDNDVVAKNWEWAVKYCDALDLNGTGWRLPNMNELNFLVDREKCNTAIDDVFTVANNYPYWASTTVASDHNKIWAVNFRCGKTFTPDKNENTFYNVRCVRGGETVHKGLVLPSVMMYLLQ